jgi:hypothetical protein
MEVTALKGPSGDVQHCANRIIAERGVRYSRMAMIPTSAQAKRRPKAYLTIETPVVARPFRAKLRNTQHRQMSSALPARTDVGFEALGASNFMEYRSEVTRLDLAADERDWLDGATSPVSMAIAT